MCQKKLNEEAPATKSETTTGYDSPPSTAGLEKETDDLPLSSSVPSSTSSFDEKKEEVVPEEKYDLGKPKRITIRARITQDEHEE